MPMPKVKENLLLLLEIRQIRSIQQLAAEQAVALKVKARHEAAAELVQEQKLVAQTLHEWNQAMASAHGFDPHMISSWAAELDRSEKREKLAQTQLVSASNELEASRRDWQQAMILFEQSDESVSAAARHVESWKEELILHDLADRAALQVAWQ